jgi:hypothetical protein
MLVKKKKKVNCTVVQALRLCTGRMAHRGSSGIGLLFLDHGTRRWRVSVTTRPLFTPGKDPLPIVQGGPLGRSEEVRKISPTTGIRSPVRPARCQSLYRLRYRAQTIMLNSSSSSSSSSSISTTAHCVLWPVEYVLPCFPICHQLSPSSYSQNLRISFYFLFPSFPGSSPSPRPFQFLSEDLFGHPILLSSL